MNCTLTTNLDYSVYDFLSRYATMTKKTKKAIIEEALKMYQNQKLKEQVEEGLKDRYDEYKTINSKFSQAQSNSVKF